MERANMGASQGTYTQPSLSPQAVVTEDHGSSETDDSHSFSCARQFLDASPEEGFLNLSSYEMPVLPREVLEEIILNLPPHQLVTCGRLVCREWKDMIDCDSVWRERCRREGYHLREGSKTPQDWRLFYFHCKKRRNLLKNPIAEDKFDGWMILKSGGDKWKIEPSRVPHPNEAVRNVFVTSYSMCTKAQLIDLVKEGYSPVFMDEFQPDIKISDWYAARWDCGCEYHLNVELLNSKKKRIKVFKPEPAQIEQWNDQSWKEMTHVFRDYGPGVRYIRFTHGGKDTQFWAGWYGIRLADSHVEICPYKHT